MGYQDGRRFTPTAEVAAAYEAIQQIVADAELPVEVTEPGYIPPSPVTPLQIVAASAPAYIVKLTVNPTFVTVERTGRFGLGGDFTYVDYPISPANDEFRDRLAAELVPLLQRELEQAANEQAADYAQSGPFGIYEAVDAVRPLDEHEPG